MYNINNENSEVSNKQSVVKNQLDFASNVPSGGLRIILQNKDTPAPSKVKCKKIIC